MVAGFLFGGLSCALCADDRPPELGRADTAYAAARARADAELLAAFDPAIERVSRLNVNPGIRLRLIETLKEEKQRLEKKGLIPWSEPMRPALEKYRQALAEAEADLRKFYTPHIDRAIRTRSEDQLQQLRTEFATALNVKTVAVWEHTPVRNPGKIRLLSNGRIGDPDGDTTWAFKQGVLTLRWPNPNAPGGVWVDVCPVSADGSMYSGKNQSKMQIGGRYIAE